MPAESAEATLAERLRFQARACRQLASPLYAALLDRVAADIEAHGPAWRVLRGHEEDPAPSALALRLMGAVNRLVLSGREPDLASAYGNPDHDDSRTWEAFRGALDRNVEELRRLVNLPVQTNEVGRCAALLLGFLTVAAATNLPLRLLEVGASAGLNLRWDRYLYLADEFTWGPIDSPVRIEFDLDGELPPVPPRVEIGARHGCDVAPIDPATPEGRLTLFAYVWPDQGDRIERMRAALKVAEELPVSIDREGAAPWAERMLTERFPGTVTVLYHSIVSQYLGERELAAFQAQTQRAAARASVEAPFAWLRMEPAGDHADLHLTTWPGGEDRHLARVGYHGTPVELQK